MILNDSDNLKRTSLFWAATRGQRFITKLLTNHNHTHVNTRRSFTGTTALHKASEFGHTDIVKLLLSQPNILVNLQRYPDGASALYLASRNGHAKVVELLLSHPHILVNAGRSSDGTNALYHASRYNHSDVVNVLIKNPNIDVNYATFGRKTSLMVASIHGRSHILKTLLSHANIDVNKATFGGKTALIYAVVNKEKVILDLLLRCPNTNTNIRDEEYLTALDRANEMNDKELITPFRIRGSLQISKGHTCCSDTIDRGLHVAITNRDSHWIKTFIACPDIKINVHNEDGYTPLNMATQKGLKYMVEILLADQRIDVNKPNTETQDNAILIASQMGHIAIMKLLLYHDQTFINQQNAKKESALSIVLKNQKRGNEFRILKLLVRCPKTKLTNLQFYGDDVSQLHGLHSEMIEKNPSCCLHVNRSLLAAAWKGDFRGIRGQLECPGSESNVNTVDNRGRTPLYIASMMGHLKAVEVLIYNSNVNSNIGVRVDGGTPFSIASERARFEVMRFLIQHGQSEKARGWCNDNWVENLKPCNDISNSPEKDESSRPNSTSGKKYLIKFFYITLLSIPAIFYG